jgi:hypothetical protein
MDILPPEQTLPMLAMRRADRAPERRTYVARPGIRALPSGAFALGAFALLQGWTLTILLWAIWWPHPASAGEYAFSLGITGLLLGLVLLVILLLLRRYPGFLLAVLRAPFVRLTVTDRRILWTLPWSRVPLMEIGRERVVGGILGQVDRRGYGNAAVILVPNDPSADIDGNIHFDRLPNVRQFLDAVRNA